MSLITPTDPMKSSPVVESDAYSPAAVTSPYEMTVTIMSPAPERPPGLRLQPHLEVLGLALDAPPLVEELGAEGRAGDDAAEGLEHRVPVHRLGVLVVEEDREMLADEVGGLVAEEADGVVDEGEAALGIQLVDDVGQGMHEVLVAPLEGVDAAGEAPVEGDEGAESRRPRARPSRGYPPTR